MSDATNSASTAWLTTTETYQGLSLALWVRPAADTPENRTAFPHLGLVTHQLGKVKPNGLPDNDYNRSLFHFDLNLQSAIMGDREGIVFLVETYAGKRNYYACLSDLESVKARFERSLRSVSGI